MRRELVLVYMRNRILFRVRYISISSILQILYGPPKGDIDSRGLVSNVCELVENAARWQ